MESNNSDAMCVRKTLNTMWLHCSKSLHIHLNSNYQLESKEKIVVARV